MKKAIFLFMCIGVLMNGQKFSDYRARYDNFDENDSHAMEFVDVYIREAKKVKNYKELSQAYRDAVYFSKEKKLMYADSVIGAASLAKDSDVIGNAYLTKGSIYYFTLRKYQKALDEYLRAWAYLENSKDSYLYHKNLYHIGVVKSYLGYYEEAYKIFSKCRQYYNTQNASETQPNLRHNRKRGYLNSLNQMSICLILLFRYKDAEPLVSEGLQQSANDKDFDLERSYFYKLKAILGYLERNDREALADFNTALAGIEKVNDFTNVSVIYYLKGKILLRNNQDQQGVGYLKKVDSIFQQNSFVLPATRETYELLIDYYRNNTDPKKELYYTNQLLKFDKILSADFKYLSTKIHKEYDTKVLIESKKKLENTSRFGYAIAAFCLIGLLVISGVGYQRIWKKRKGELVRTQAVMEISGEESQETNSVKSFKLPEHLVADILNKLKHMEEKNFYLEKGLTQSQLAKKLKTNTAYLSAIINEHKGCNFNTYINRLRIMYAKEMLTNDPLWRKYAIDDISRECGFSNRSNFSKLFLEMTAMSPVEFIRKIEQGVE
ncbi:helix-turn-helix domain-containing protein [Chryseobacterium sp. MA9]|uniref:helix-turn-helix domain-containing protein n=1 Tax=Chryseobacterium sp. MA9 TaxID=2966625 RepID=UPI002107E4C4|nr:helix-turn-helix domain-containing protein [Chryseobacterium sp. MA9]UTX48874.1 AraC family transcriptional regulator [Chryseobacterium sp. MA9]